MEAESLLIYKDDEIAIHIRKDEKEYLVLVSPIIEGEVRRPLGFLLGSNSLLYRRKDGK